jgi:hypothetical protein
LCSIKDEGPGEGVKAKGVSGKEVHEIPDEEGQDPSTDWRVRETQIEGKDQNDVWSYPLNGE